MACYTFDAAARIEPLSAGIEFREDGDKKVVEIRQDGKTRDVPFCRDFPPKRVVGLTLQCGVLMDGKIASVKKTTRPGEIALVHVQNASKIMHHRGSALVIGKETALVQLIPGDCISIRNHTKNFRMEFSNGQLEVSRI